METSRHRDEIKSASPQRACPILVASGVPCDEAGLLAQPSTQAPCSYPKSGNRGSWEVFRSALYSNPLVSEPFTLTGLSSFDGDAAARPSREGWEEEDGAIYALDYRGELQFPVTFVEDGYYRLDALGALQGDCIRRRCHRSYCTLHPPQALPHMPQTNRTQRPNAPLP